MKKFTSVIIILFIIHCSKAQSYKIYLDKINDYLKTFDNGYYGYLEIEDGFLYDRFKSGKYFKSEIKYLGTAIESEAKRKVIMNCLNNKECVYSTYTDSYHNNFSFSQTKDFNTSELITLLNNLILAYRNNDKETEKNTNSNLKSNSKIVEKNSNSTANSERDQKAKERLQNNSNIEDTENNESTNSKLPRNKNYVIPLKKLNDYLKIFNPETYKDIEVTDNKVYFGFTYYTKVYKSYIDISELKQNTTIVKGTDQVKIFCKGGKKCFYSTFSNDYVDHFRFFSNSIKDFTKIEQLLKDFIEAL